jgi:hypothetical protein
MLLFDAIDRLAVALELLFGFLLALGLVGMDAGPIVRFECFATEGVVLIQRGHRVA